MLVGQGTEEVCLLPAHSPPTPLRADAGAVCRGEEDIKMMFELQIHPCKYHSKRSWSVEEVWVWQ